jgi:hypothetical protein
VDRLHAELKKNRRFPPFSEADGRVRHDWCGQSLTGGAAVFHQSYKEVVLASELANTRKLLTAAGLAFRIVPPQVDEAAIHEALRKANAETDPGDVAELLAGAKAGK